MAIAYQKLIDLVDELTAMLSAYYSKHLVCRAGCSGCCHHHLSVFPVEAGAVREALEALPAEIFKRIESQALDALDKELRGEPVACPLLVDDRCSIYESRPLICRTQGLPLLIKIDDRPEEPGEVDFCPLNFTLPAAVEDLDEEHLVPLDAINLKLAMVNLQYCRENGIEGSATGTRRKMSEIILGRDIYE